MKISGLLASLAVILVPGIASAQFGSVQPCCEPVMTAMSQPYYVSSATVDPCASMAEVPCGPMTAAYDPCNAAIVPTVAVQPYQPYVAPQIAPTPAPAYAPSIPYVANPQAYQPQGAAVPVTPVRPVVPQIPASFYVGRGLFGQPTMYGQGQPVRNFFRFLVP